ncbi:hypothetical protein FXO38_32783 [Capsicum annuum]|nr:hypothetical protein FXO38_32783 [Capsicum annuum]KAF3624298.1 hypothetical protein FXO37_31452 [Capsicum annuum]
MAGQNSYDLMAYVLQWKNTFCRTLPCKPGPGDVFSIYGLWPANATGHNMKCLQPQGREKDVDVVALPIADYFKGAVMVHNNLIAINNKNNLCDYLAEGGVRPSTANTYTKQVIITAVQHLVGANNNVCCMRGRFEEKHLSQRDPLMLGHYPVQLRFLPYCKFRRKRMREPHLPNYNPCLVFKMFSVDRETDGFLGLPGRVYRKKLSEWTPNVQYYSSREFPRLNHALHCNVRGTLALPVFETYGQSCVGVLELIMISQKINYAPEVDKVGKALEVGFYHFYYIAL